MRDRRAWIFLAVLLAHAVLLRIVLLASLRAIPPSREAGPLTLIYLKPTPETAGAGKPSLPGTPSAAARPSRTRARTQPEPSNAITPPVPTAAPPIDWAREAELAAADAAAAEAGNKPYRDLSSLTPEQLEWMKRNRMEPGPPGIAWSDPRFRLDPVTGIPVLWINDHCVLVFLIVACRIGRIEPNGHLFDHMRDPQPRQ
jgi:hypothetical protein